MEIVRISFSKKVVNTLDSLSLAIGNFDGLHKGHQFLLEKVVQEAKEKKLIPSVLTFDPHPAEILGGKKEQFYISTFDEKLKVLESLGIQRVYFVKFSKQFASLSAEDFFEEYLAPLSIKSLFVGKQFKFGKKKLGDIRTLEVLCKKDKVNFYPQDLVSDKEGKFSSSRLREYLQEGAVDIFNEMRGRAFVLPGKVIYGQQKGRTIGFPTANLSINKKKLVPKLGVYGVSVDHNNKNYFGVMNIGFKPTVSKKKELSYEIHLFDFDKEIYGDDLVVSLLYYIREEKKFTSFEELKIQIEKDILFAKEKFKNVTN